jgi:O-antigen/teichoic acid export membrane protein
MAGATFFGLAVSAGVVTFFSAAWFPGVPQRTLWLTLPILPLTLALSVVTSLFQAKQRFDYFNLSTVVPALCSLLAAAVLSLWHSVDLMIVAVAVGRGGGLVASIILLANLVKGEAATSTVDSPYAGRALRYGMKSYLSNALTFLTYRADVYLIGLFLTPAAAGLYVVATNVAERIWLLSTATSAILFPKISSMAGDEQGRAALTPVVFRWVLLLSLLGAVALALVSPLLLPIVFGPAFTASEAPLLWLCPGIVALAGSRVLANDIAGRGRPEINMYIAAACLITNVALNAILIPIFGIVAAAFSSSASYLLHLILTVSVYRTFVRQNPRTLFFGYRADLKRYVHS